MSEYINSGALSEKRTLEIGPAAIAANGNYPSDNGVYVGGHGKGSVHIQDAKTNGDWDDATAKVQYAMVDVPAANNWYDAPEGSLTEDGCIEVEDVAVRWVRINVAGSSGATVLDYYMVWQVT